MSQRTKAEAATNPQPGDRWRRKGISLAGVRLTILISVKRVNGDDVIYEKRRIAHPSQIDTKIHSTKLPVFQHCCRDAEFLGGVE